MILKSTLIALALAASAGHAGALPEYSSADSKQSVTIGAKVDAQNVAYTARQTSVSRYNVFTLEPTYKATSTFSTNLSASNRSGSSSLYLVLVFLLGCTLRLWLSSGLNPPPRL